MANATENLYSTTGIQLPKDACVVIVRTEWNADTMDKLEAGCKKVLDQNRVPFKVVTVPGAFEIPFCIKSYWDAYKYKEDKPAAFIALGCVIKGDTPHFDFVCKGITEGMVQVNLALPVPSIFGILTVDSQQQIDERTGGKHGHKGEEAAVAALKMISLKKSFSPATF